MKSLALAFCLLAAVGGWGQVQTGINMCSAITGNCEWRQTTTGWVLSAPDPKAFICFMSDGKFSISSEPPSRLPDCINMSLPIITQRAHLPSVEPLPWDDPFGGVLLGGLYTTGTILEPIDVPAISECDKKVEIWQVCPFPPDFPKHTGYHWTCKDRTRILETAGDGKHWCRKVQP